MGRMKPVISLARANPAGYVARFESLQPQERLEYQFSLRRPDFAAHFDAFLDHPRRKLDAVEVIHVDLAESDVEGCVTLSLSHTGRRGGELSGQEFASLGPVSRVMRDAALAWAQERAPSVVASLRLLDRVGPQFAIQAASAALAQAKRVLGGEVVGFEVILREAGYERGPSPSMAFGVALLRTATHPSVTCELAYAESPDDLALREWIRVQAKLHRVACRERPEG